jgi:hypothetical protein
VIYRPNYRANKNSNWKGRIVALSQKEKNYKRPTLRPTTTNTN